MIYFKHCSINLCVSNEFFVANVFLTCFLSLQRNWSLDQKPGSPEQNPSLHVLLDGLIGSDPLFGFFNKHWFNLLGCLISLQFKKLWYLFKTESTFDSINENYSFVIHCLSQLKFRIMVQCMHIQHGRHHERRKW